MTTLLKSAMAKAQTLPDAEQDRLASILLREVEAALRASGPNVNRRSVWEDIAAIGADVPDEVWEQLPRDGAAEHDHVLYGTPKRTS